METLPENGSAGIIISGTRSRVSHVEFYGSSHYYSITIYGTVYE